MNENAESAFWDEKFCTLSKRAIKILDVRLRIIWVKIDRLVGSNDPEPVYSVFEEPTDSVSYLV